MTSMTMTSLNHLLIPNAVHAVNIDHPDQAIANLTCVTSLNDGNANGLHHVVLYQHANHQLVSEVGELVFDGSFHDGCRER
jgi:hypothetical protein